MDADAEWRGGEEKGESIQCSERRDGIGVHVKVEKAKIGITIAMKITVACGRRRERAG